MILVIFPIAEINEKYIYIYNEKKNKNLLCRNLEGLLPKTYCEEILCIARE